MASRYNSQQAATVDQDNRNMATGVNGVAPMSGEINSIWTAIDAINAVSSSGFAIVSTTGLTLGIGAGSILVGGAVVGYAGGTIALNASTTNYVEIDSSGTLHASTGSFTAGRFPLYTVVTASTSMATPVSAVPAGSATPAASVTGALLSAAAATKTIEIPIGSLTAAATFPLVAPCTGTLTACSIVASNPVGTSDANNWQFGLTDVGATGTLTNQLVSTNSVNSTRATGGSALAAFSRRVLALATIVSGTERNVAKGDVLLITATLTGTATATGPTTISMDFIFTN